MAVNEPAIILAMVGAPITTLALLGFLGAPLHRGITLALLILFGNTTSFYCFSSL
jgi:hypothetical protein